MNVQNKKIAFLTFKIVEETIKRVCLKVQTDKLMPVQGETLRRIKNALQNSSAFRHLNSGQLVLPRPEKSITEEVMRRSQSQDAVN